MLSAVSWLSHDSTIAVTGPAPREYSTVARDTLCGDPVTVNLMISPLLALRARATLAQWSNQLEAEF